MTCNKFFEYKMLRRIDDFNLTEYKSLKFIEKPELQLKKRVGNPL